VTAFARALREYLALRRSLGSQLRGPEFHLRRFVEFLDLEGAEVITVDLALRWATAPGRASLATRAGRLGDVRRFAAWLSATEPRTEIPPRDLLPQRYRRTPPYIYSDAEIARIVLEAARLPSPAGLRARTFATLFGLIAVTGLRLGEAVALDQDDVDFDNGVLAVRRGKFGKSRFVPLHDTTRDALRGYARARDRLRPRPATPAFFIAEHGRRVTSWSARYTFAVVSRAIGLRAPTTDNRHGRGPRIHDLRHRLAVRTLIRWYREGRDVERELPKLATYLGHAHVTDTYWYLEAVPELLQLATERATRANERSS
jgi:integrase/recombinase XerD